MGWVDEVNNHVVERIRAHPQLGDKTYTPITDEVGNLRLPTQLPYVLIFPDAGTASSITMGAEAGIKLFNYTIHMVGETDEQIFALANAVQMQLLRWRIALPGFRSWRMTQNFSTPINSRDDVRPPLLYIVEEWALQTMKGS